MHTQTYVFANARGEHVPPFKHGFDAHCEGVTTVASDENKIQQQISKEKKIDIDI